MLANCGVGLRNVAHQPLLCEDVNECSDAPCPGNATCTNTYGSYACACNSGFIEQAGGCVLAPDLQCGPGLVRVDGSGNALSSGVQCGMVRRVWLVQPSAFTVGVPVLYPPPASIAVAWTTNSDDFRLLGRAPMVREQVEAAAVFARPTLTSSFQVFTLTMADREELLYLRTTTTITAYLPNAGFTLVFTPPA